MPLETICLTRGVLIRHVFSVTDWGIPAPLAEPPVTYTVTEPTSGWSIGQPSTTRPTFSAGACSTELGTFVQLLQAGSAPAFEILAGKRFEVLSPAGEELVHARHGMLSRWTLRMFLSTEVTRSFMATTRRRGAALTPEREARLCSNLLLRAELVTSLATTGRFHGIAQPDRHLELAVAAAAGRRLAIVESMADVRRALEAVSSSQYPEIPDLSAAWAVLAAVLDDVSSRRAVLA